MTSQLKGKRRLNMNRLDVKVVDAVALYMANHEDRNHSRKTLIWYRQMLGKFTEHMGSTAKLSALTPDRIRDYLRTTRDRKVSKFTLHAYARTLKTFLRWLGREGFVAAELWTSVELPKVPSYQDVTIDVLTEDEIASLLNMFDSNTDVGARDRAIFCLMVESGLRLEEVANLKVSDVHTAEMYVKVHGKGDRESYVPLGGTTCRALTRYATAFRIPVDTKTETFFLTVYGYPLKYQAIPSIFDRLARKSGISRLHPHLLRHTAATRMLSNGADLHSVQRLLRHRDVRTTLRYLHLIPEQLQDKMRLFSPLLGVNERKVRVMPRAPVRQREGGTARPVLRAIR
jgi:integrase/recombinase XerC/integrase/recombinase XerD